MNMRALGEYFLVGTMGGKYRFSCVFVLDLSGPSLKLCGAEGEELLTIIVFERKNGVFQRSTFLCSLLA